jgi:aryl sulfotransferase
MAEPPSTGPGTATVLQAGVPRSGNSWLYRILLALYERAGVPWRSYIADHPIQEAAHTWELSLAGQAQINMVDITPDGCYLGVSTVFHERLDDYDDFVRRCLVVWTHSPFDPRASQAFERFGTVLYIVRDVRDVLLSMAHFRHTPYSERVHPRAASRNAAEYAELNADDLAWYWTKHVASYLAARSRLNLEVVFYERLKADPAGSTAALASRLGLDVPPAAVTDALAATDFTAMRATSPQHLRTGTAGRWREELTADQVRRVEEVAGPMMDLLGYPRAGAQAAGALPAVPAGPIAAAVREALVSCQRVATQRCRPGWAV